eukprot:3507447-Prymnesium_polylepis.1
MPRSSSRCVTADCALSYHEHNLDLETENEREREDESQSICRNIEFAAAPPDAVAPVIPPRHLRVSVCAGHLEHLACRRGLARVPQGAVRPPGDTG